MIEASSSRIKAAISAQSELCSRQRLPHFAPSDGVCWSCRRQIYDLLDGRSYVTGCPFCCRSYCD